MLPCWRVGKQCTGLIREQKKMLGQDITAGTPRGSVSTSVNFYLLNDLALIEKFEMSLFADGLNAVQSMPTGSKAQAMSLVVMTTSFHPTLGVQ